MDLTNTQIALLGMIAWTILLVMSLGSLRAVISVTQNKPANSFTPTGEDIAGVGQRMTRAHANCYEFLPFAGLALLYGIATGQTAVTEGTALILLGARIGQSLVHIVSTSVPAVLIRFVLFVVQLVLVLYWVVQFAGLI